MNDIDPAEVAARVCECRKGDVPNPWLDYCDVHRRPWPCRVLRGKTEVIRAALEQAWDKGYASGHSRAMRRMSDEPNVAPAVNPYQKETP